ncbi:ABC transporter permease subunit [Azospirillum soli]|uniref:ABC transporter permease subunit n=1 Tax=Azospirillum soli TaxID=1304799 RepID=UPI001FE4BF8E|nr:ABC transporter permease subunit [Azospirillum soli]MBP2311757.1 oligopeptide transport system permease protein [Azospirillum soli]
MRSPATDTPWHMASRRLTAHRPAVAGLAVLAALALAVPAAPLLGGGVVADALSAGQGSLAFALLAGLIGGGAGVVWGTLAVALGQRAERAMMSLANRLMGLPLVLGVLLASGLAGRGLGLLAGMVALTAAPAVAVLTQGELRSLLRREFLTAAQASGLSGRAILRRHIAPNAALPLAAAAWTALPRALAAESFASLLGLGLPDGVPSWGGQLATAVRLGDPLAVAPPALLLALSLWSLCAIGDGLRAAAGGRP